MRSLFDLTRCKCYEVATDINGEKSQSLLLFCSSENTEIKAIGHLEVRLGHQASSLPAQRWVQIIQLYTVAGGLKNPI